MKRRNDRSPPQPGQPRKRFHVERLEERIAPRKGGKGTHNCAAETEAGCGGQSGGTTACSYSTIF